MAVTAPPADTAVETPATWYALDPEDVVHELHSNSTAGLTAAEVEERRASYGPNRFAEAKKEPQWRGVARPHRVGGEKQRAGGAAAPPPVPRPDADRARRGRHRQHLPGQAAQHRPDAA